ncbi:MAG: hypothetical protein DHS20C05_21380 [Hyphococcus sp.]|nr:MAG: hypothetical protein DHS20C05_21380 [Marinicaulis sp.]
MVLDRSVAKDSNDKKVFDNIEHHDCHVISVANRVGEEGPIFSYSIGLQTSLGCPELLIIGLSSKLAHAMINGYRDDIKAGREFIAGEFYSGFLEGFDVLLIEANQTARKKYAIWADWYHERKEFPLFQCIWPTTSGVWPWSANASDDLKSDQPILGTLPSHLQ